MAKLTKLELQIMESLWSRGELSVREMQEAFPRRDRPAYTTVQTTVYRMEKKRFLRRTRQISNAHIFAPLVTRQDAHRRLIDDLLALLGGQTQPVMAHLVQSGKLTLQDVHEAEAALRRLSSKEKT